MTHSHQEPPTQRASSIRSSFISWSGDGCSFSAPAPISLTTLASMAISDRRCLHAHGLGAAGLGLRHPAPAGAGVGIRGDHGVRIRLHAYPPGHIFRANGVATVKTVGCAVLFS